MTETTYDVGMDANGDLPEFTRHITGPDLTAQRLAVRLGTILRTWFLDLRVGLPYLEWSDGKATTKKLNAMGSLIRATSMADPNVTEIQDWTQSFTPETQAVAFRFIAIIESQAYDFVVEPFGDSTTFPCNGLPHVAINQSIGVL